MSDFNENMGNLLNPNQAFDYIEEDKNLFTYQDSVGNKYFLTIQKEVGSRKYQILIGWYDENGNQMFEPALPNNIVSEDNNKRGNTVSKIFIEKVLPLVEKRNMEFSINCLDAKRAAFSKRLMKKFIDNDKHKLDEKEINFVLKKKRIFTKK